MNDFKLQPEIPLVQEFPSPSEQPEFNYRFEDIIDEANQFISETDEFIKELFDSSDIIDNAREYGLKECSDAAKEIFTPEIISEWGNMSYEQRNVVIQEYSKAIGQGLAINFKGVIFENWPENIRGQNGGDGYLHLNMDFLTNPKNLIGVIDTIAHEARHQFQFEAIKNPENFKISQETIKEWTAGLENYTDQYATAYDPWGYHYNPVEIDARYFGETMVRELTKDLINS